MKKSFKKIGCAAVGLVVAGSLLLSALPSLADLPAVAVKPRIITLVSNQALTNLETHTFNLSTNLLLTAAYQHKLTFWGSTVSTNTAGVVGTTIAKLKFAFDPAGTNFVADLGSEGVLQLNNFGTTNAFGATNLDTVLFDGATAVQLSTAVTTCNTNGAVAGQLTGQSVSFFLNLTP